MKRLTKKRVLELFDYNQETGELIRKVATSSQARLGVPITSSQVSIDGKAYMTSKICWYHARGIYPQKKVGFANGDSSDFRLCNLVVAPTRKSLTRKRVRDLLEYDSVSGVLKWRISRSSSARQGDIATTKTRGRLVVTIDGKGYDAGRVVWLHAFGGGLPDKIYYHDGDKTNLKINNLSIVSPLHGLSGVDKLKAVYHYDPETGVFRWNMNSGVARKGDIAGSKDKHGYVRLWLDGKLHLAHRLAWLYVHGYMPEHGIDHKNGDQSDNRLENLREASKTCNAQNTKVRINNKSGFPGVSFDRERSKWVASIRLGGKNYNLGRYDTALEAALARLTVEICDDRWTCNYRSELIEAIRREWPEFNLTTMEV